MAVEVRALCASELGDEFEACWLPGLIASVDDGVAPNSVRLTVHVEAVRPLPNAWFVLGIVVILVGSQAG
jgi:hypothetical protein